MDNNSASSAGMWWSGAEWKTEILPALIPTAKTDQLVVLLPFRSVFRQLLSLFTGGLELVTFADIFFFFFFLNADLSSPTFFQKRASESP